MGTGSIGQRHLTALRAGGKVCPVAFPVRPQRCPNLRAAGFQVIQGWPEALQAKVQATRQLGIDSEDTADLLWEIENGPVISMRLDYLSRPNRRFMRACGEYGALD